VSTWVASAEVVYVFSLVTGMLFVELRAAAA
jgi:hypothetical protein